jgi:hypothetical protein
MIGTEPLLKFLLVAILTACVAHIFSRTREATYATNRNQAKSENELMQ